MVLRYFLVNAYNYLNEIFCFNFPTAIEGSLRLSISPIKGYKSNIRRMIKILFLFSGFYVRFILNIFFLRPGDQIARVSKMLADEYGTASNIKSRVNRLSVLGAITSVQHRLKLYAKVPPNGLVSFLFLQL